MSEARKPVTMLVIPADLDEPVSVVTADGSRDGVRQVLGAASADLIPVIDDVCAWVDALGQNKQLPRNARAGRLINSYVPDWTHYSAAYGTAVIVGLDVDADAWSDVPEPVVAKQQFLG